MGLSVDEALAGELLHAIVMMDVPRARSVLARGADPTMLDVEFPLAWQWIRRSPERSSLMHDAVLLSSARRGREDRLDMIDLLLEYGAPWDGANYDGYTPLHNAALVNHAPAAQRLLALGADVDAVSKKNYTPLQAAIFYESGDVAEALLTHGASTRIRNHHGEDAIDYAERVNVEVVSMLRSAASRRAADAAMRALDTIVECETAEQADRLAFALRAKAAVGDMTPRPHVGASNMARFRRIG